MMQPKDHTVEEHDAMPLHAGVASTHASKPASGPAASADGQVSGVQASDGTGAETVAAAESEADTLDHGPHSGHKTHRKAQRKANSDALGEDGDVAIQAPSVPHRRCIVTRTSLPETDLMRFVVGPDDQLFFDIKRRLPGRGAWITAERAMVEKAVKSKLFNRAFKKPVTVPDGFVTGIEAMLEQSVLGALGLARKAGLAASGFSKVEAMIGSGRSAVLLHATDAAADGMRKLLQAVRRAETNELPVPIVDTRFSSERLGVALGHPHVIHASVNSDPRAASVGVSLQRLRRFSAERAASETPGSTPVTPGTTPSGGAPPG